MPPLARPNEAIIVIIGMRGAGKTTLSREAARLLDCEFADLDELITRANCGKRPPELVQERGWEGFRELELSALSQALAGEHARLRPAVVACGGGVVETARGVEQLEHHWPVVFIDRHIDDIAEYLERAAGSTEAHRVPLGEDVRETYRRRLPKYESCADFRLPVVAGEADTACLGRALARLLRLIVGAGGGIYLGPDTFSVSMGIRDVNRVPADLIESVAIGADVLELRVDLLETQARDYVVRQVAILRRHTCGTPLLFTVRSVEHGGKFAGSEDEYFGLLQLGLELGCELVDVECTWSEARISQIVGRRCSSLLVGSFHDFNRMPERTELAGLFKRCSLDGAAAVAKVVVKATSREDNWLVQDVGAASVPPGVVFVGLCVGNDGRLSRVLNQALCPATHPALVSMAPAPGQLSVNDILGFRWSLALLARARQFPLFCCRLGLEAMRILPDIHSAAFEELSLPHICRAEYVDSAEEVLRVLRLTSVGGAAVSGALREELVPRLAGVSEAARHSGAVDVLVRKEANQIFGDNTECLAIRARLEALGMRSGASARAGLVLGGGATGGAALCALQELGFGRVLLRGGWGKTASLAEDVAAALDLPSLDVLVLADIPELDSLDVLASTQVMALLVPALERLKPLVVETAWPPRLCGTSGSLCERASAAGCAVVEAPDILLEQVCLQCRLWTSQHPPRRLMAQSLLHEVFKVQDPTPFLLREAA